MLVVAGALSLCAGLFFGLALVLTQYGLRDLRPLHGALVSIPVSAAIFWLLSPFVMHWDAANFTAIVTFAAVGVLFPASVTLLTFEANRRMGPSVAGAVGSVTPLFAVALAALLLGEMPQPPQIIAITMIIAGVILLSADRRWLSTKWPYWSVVLPLSAAAIRGLTQPLSKIGFAFWSSPFAAALFGYTASSLVIVCAVMARRKTAPVILSASGIAWFAGVGLCNGLAVLAMYTALSQGPVSLVSPLVATYPLVTLVASAMLRSVTVSLLLLGGISLTVLGCVLLILA